MKIAVAGGTGVLGAHVVDVARAGGDHVVVLSRAGGVDVRTGAGLEEALRGVEVVVDAVNAGTTDGDAATAFFVEEAASLQRAAAAAGVRRLVVVSIVGVDRAPVGYYAAKLAQERVVRDGPVPVDVLRATQFHEMAIQALHWDRRDDGTAHVPALPVRTVAARTVAEALVTLARGGGARPPADLGGPQDGVLSELSSRAVASRGASLRVVAEPSFLPGDELRGDATLVSAGPSFDEWLASPDAAGLAL